MFAFVTSHKFCLYLVGGGCLFVDVEHRPDAVYPFSDTITCTAISHCSSHMAVGLKNGNVQIWDQVTGKWLYVSACSCGYLSAG